MSEAFRAGYVRACLEGTARRFFARAVLDIIVNASLEWLDAVGNRLFNPPQETRSMVWQSTWTDVRHALRLFARAPAFTGLAVLAFALGIGANSAIFTIVNAVLLNPLPYADPDGLVMIWGANPDQGTPLSAMSEGDAIDIRRATTTLARVEMFQANIVPIQLTVDANTMSARAVAVTADTFSLLGRDALLGRTLRAGDRFTIVLGHGYWQRQFGGDPGVVFRTENLLTMQVNVPRRYDTADTRRDFYRQLFDRLEAVPGVIGVGGTTRLPLGGANSSTQVTVEGRELSRGGLVDVGLRRAMHDYFSVMGMSIVRGRAFDRRDGPDAPPVVVINETMARRVFPGEDPIGRTVRLAENAGIGLATIIGVVSDVRHDGLEAAPAPEIYIHYLQNPPSAPLVVLRTASDPSAMSADVRRAAHEIDPTLRVFDVRTMADLRAEAVSQRQFLTLLAVLFGGLALTLAIVGVFGVMTLVVTERTQEMGIRLALGAAPSQVLGLVIGEGLILAGVGVVLGLAASMALTPLMASHLYGVGAADPVTLAGVPALLLAVALLACVIPARRAMRVDPVTALRYE